MKKLLSLILCIFVLVCSAYAETEGADAAVTSAPEENVVYVTVSVAGELVLIRHAVELRDVDEDGAFTVNDALVLAHEAAYVAEEDGSEAQEGFVTEVTEYGLSMVRLWGVENGGSYGYCVNNTSCFSLYDTVKAGDEVVAYSFADLEGWSDTYTYFTAFHMAVQPGEEVTLSMFMNTYDEEWNPVTYAVGNANITVNGQPADMLTDENGCITVSFAEEGEYIISASVEDLVIVPPVCVITVGNVQNDITDTVEEVVE